MTNVTTHKTIDEAGAEAVLDAAEQHAREHGHRVVIAVVERSGELVGAAAHARCADRQLARGRRQGADGCDLRAAQPRDRAAGQRADGSVRSRFTAPAR